MPSFAASVAVLGVLLIIGALASGLAERSVLSLAALFVVGGFIAGRGGLGWIDLKTQSGFVTDLALVALIVILFRDGLEVDGEMLQRAWHLPLRKLALAMPLTAGAIALAARGLFGFSWTEALLIGALLSPTDPVLTSSIVTNPRVPRLVRHSLNLESGLNDGLALPAVLAFAAALSVSSKHFVWWQFLLQDLGLGLLFGLGCGWLASVLLPQQRGALQLEPRAGKSPQRNGSVGHLGAKVARRLARALTGKIRQSYTDTLPAHQKSLYALGAAFATYGLTVLSPEGNGFIAVFVAAIVLGMRRRDIAAHFELRGTEIVEIVKVGIFLVFGSLLSVDALTHEGWATIAFVAIAFLFARPVAVWLSLIGTNTDPATRLFMGWFGPKGVATITFSLLILNQPIPSGGRIFDLTAAVVLCSVVLHGAADTPGARWIGNRSVRAGDLKRARGTS